MAAPSCSGQCALQLTAPMLTSPDAGLGLYEYMMLAEILEAEPVWVINAGISHQQDIPTSQIAPWIQVNAAEALPGLQMPSL